VGVLILLMRAFMRKPEFKLVVIVVSLLSALLSSAWSMSNMIYGEVKFVASVSGCERYLVVNSSSPHSALSSALLNYVEELPSVKELYPQCELEVAAERGGLYTTTLRIVEDLEGFIGFLCPKALKLGGLEGGGVVVGCILAEALNISPGDTLTLLIDGGLVRLPVTGVVKCYQQVDAEVLMEFEVARDIGLNLSVTSILLEADKSFNPSLVEESFRGVDVLRMRDVDAFLSSVSGQLTSIVDLWSLAIYVFLALAAYVVAIKLTSSLRYEVELLRSMGARGPRLVAVALTCFFTASLASSAFGVSLGLVSSQSAVTFMQWVGRSFAAHPHLGVLQALQVVAYSSASFTLGCVAPVVAALRRFEVL